MPVGRGLPANHNDRGGIAQGVNGLEKSDQHKHVSGVAVYSWFFDEDI